MIADFKCSETEKMFLRESSVKLPQNIQKSSFLKLKLIDQATLLKDLNAFPGNRLEKMKGDRKDRYSIRINKQWRICFEWCEGNAYEVEINTMKKNKIPPVHPGTILMEELLKPLKISQYRLAKDVGVSPRRINEIVLGKRAITVDTALRIGKYFGTSPELWLGLQNSYDMDVAMEKLEERLEIEVKVLKRK